VIGGVPANILEGWDILIVDDEPDSRIVASYVLDYYGATVHTANNGKEGLERAIALRPRFIIADLSMPVMDGWEMLRQLKANPATREIPVIALTAHAMLGDRDKALAAGFHNYLTKPLTAETFIHDLLALLVDIPVLAVYLKQD
jgi:two-component system cell cycle response regulator